MLFHSYTFLAFFLAVVAVHEAVPKRHRRLVLLVASYVFYSSWNAKYALLIALSTTIDYLAARGIVASRSARRKKLLLVLSLSMNLGLLALFKYYNFFGRSLEYLAGVDVPLHDLLLPVGISFYTFQSMSYTIDVYRGRIQRSSSFVDFALYVSFFPQLVAGPIVRAAEFLPQITAPAPRTRERIRLGLKLFFVGLFKKVILADSFALFVDSVHAAPTAAGGGDLWVAAYAFAFQIYFDFSGYSDMAIGLAHLLGYRFPENFRRPYCARNVSEFWRRWHISLSTWLRDYLYIPLGGSRGTSLATARNLMITMVLGGLWHGANWTFIVWGLLHGAFLGIHRTFRSLTSRVEVLARPRTTSVATPLAILTTFHCWVFSMVFFRSQSIAVALDIFRRMFSFGLELSASAPAVLASCAFLLCWQQVQERWDMVESFDDWPLSLRTATLVLGAIVLVLFKPTAATPFLYFQF